MRALTFTLQLLDPLLATGLEGDPNSGVSLPYIPGSVIRGALIALYLRDKDKERFDPNDKERKLFFEGTVRYLNAYPLTDDGKRSLPTPLSWHARKDIEIREKEFEVLDFAQGENTPSNIRERLKNEQAKPLSSPFYYFREGYDNNTFSLVKSERRLMVHTQRERRHGRAMENDGAVFRYESIASGERFGGVILSDDEPLLDGVKSLLDIGQLRLGGSRTAGYGRAVIKTIKAPADEEANQEWREVLMPGNGINEGTEFTVTFLSNALLRDDCGQYQADLTAAQLEESLGNVSPCNEYQDEKFNRTFKRAEIIGGFNRKWGLPLPQAVSLKAGSVFTFKAGEDIAEQSLKDFVDAGIGDRRVDGFGRVAISITKEPMLRCIEADKSKLPDQSITKPLSRDLAKQMLARMLRQRLDQQLIERVGRLEIQKESIPPNSQIARLRMVIREALRLEESPTEKLSDKVKKRANDFFESNRQTARQHFERARMLIDGESPKDADKRHLQSWVKRTLDKLDEFTPPSLLLGKGESSVKAEFGDALKAEYHLRLIDNVLARAAKDREQ